MKGKAFLLGFYSVGGQVLLLRELVGSFGGDELFIGTALFGWLGAVALGAWFGGRKERPVPSSRLFVLGAAALLVMLPAARLAPMLTGQHVVETVPFATAAAVSMALMLPVGLIAGWLFSSISREGWRPVDSIVGCYLWEGLGAFAGGLVLLMLVGPLLSSQALGLGVGMAVIFYLLFNCRRWPLGASVLIAAALAAVLLTLPRLSGAIEKTLDTVKYDPYDVAEAFDTHYGHQTVLSRDSLITLVTDGRVEASHPDLQSAEMALLPPLAYRPEASDILVLGRSEVGIRQLVAQLPHINMISVDPRLMDATLDRFIPYCRGGQRFRTDPITFFTLVRTDRQFDVVLLNAGQPNNYQSSRLLTPEFLRLVRQGLRENGVLYVLTTYDSDRYVSEHTSRPVAVIHNTLREVFEHVAVWPGENTLFFASAGLDLSVSVDSLTANLGRLNYDPLYFDDFYLADHLGDLKVRRLESAVAAIGVINEINRPLLPHLQAMLDARRTDSADIVGAFFDRPLWLIALALLIVMFLIRSVTGKDRNRRFSFFLFFVAGFVSLSLELISFYVYQSLSGSLFSEIAVLIGVFMMGLAAGTFYSMKYGARHLEYPSLLFLLLAVVAFPFTYDRVPAHSQLYYHLMFLFTVAVCTGALFVAATERYCSGDEPLVNRGAGYALELIGSALASLLTMTILLPAIGLNGVLVSLGAIIVVTFVGSARTAR